MSVIVGTAGFSYKDWKGNFYPAEIDSRSMLEEYSRYFPIVEINSTYYAIPSARSVQSMAQRTPTEFVFTVKANREMTHEIDDTGSAHKRFRVAMRPLIDHGKLGCVMAQFPWGFKNTAENRDYLRVLADRMEGLDTVVEFRSDSWEEEGTMGLLRELGLGFCCVDEPRLRGLLSDKVEVTSNIGYVRFHGRNRKTWWGKDREPWERYDYLYTEEELGEWVPKVRQIAGSTDRAYIIFNNHYKGQAPANARAFTRMLTAALGEEIVSYEDPSSGSVGLGDGKLPSMP